VGLWAGLAATVVTSWDLMRIAVYHNLPSGGGKRTLHEMVRRLADRHTIDAYSLASADHDFCDIRPYCRSHTVFAYEALPLARSPLGRINQAIRCADLLRRRALERRVAAAMDQAGYDAAFVHNCQFGQSPNVLSFLRGPSAYFCAEPPRPLYEPEPNRPYNRSTGVRPWLDRIDPLIRVYRATLRRIDRTNTQAATLVLTNSAYSQEILYRVYGISARVCPLGVDTERFRPIAQPRRNFVMSAGALQPNKGFDFLMQSLALIDAGRRPPLVIVSNAAVPGEREYLQQLADGLGVQVDFRTLVSDDELVCLYNQALLTLYAPVMEPFGLVPLESMACGTAVIGVREAGVRESILDEQTGLLTERDPEQFKEATVRLLDDAAARRRFGQQGRLQVEQLWQWDGCARTVERYLVAAAMSRPHQRR
jgi:glycosyltransferase involved in cell wall biosynthesis